MTSRDRFLTRIWGTVEEPRIVTITTVAAYAVTVMLGYSLLIAPPTGHDKETWLRVISAMLLVGGGTTGVPGAWMGARWLEQGSAFASAAGLGVTLTLVLAVHQERSLATPWITVLTLVLAALFWAARYLRVRGDAYAPGKGPLLPEQRLAVEDALDTGDER